MTTRPAMWGATLGSALALFVVAVALVMSGPGSAPANVSPTPPAVAHATPGASAIPATPGPDDTPTPEPTAPSTDKVEPRRSVGPKQLTGYGWPLKRAWITSKFGPRDFGNFVVIDGVPYHDGLDIATHCGDKVYAAHDGRVLANDRTYDRYLGYHGTPEAIYARLERLGRVNALAIAVVIDDGNGYRSVYAHFGKVVVKKGKVVKAGQLLGYEGRTGRASGCHLHYGLFSPAEVATFGIDPTVVKRMKLPDRQIARIDPMLVLGERPKPPEPSAKPSPSAGS